MKSFGHPVRMAAMALIMLALATSALGQGEETAPISEVSAASVSTLTNDECAMCHGGDDPEVPRVSDATLTHSSHEGFACVDCHADVAEIPHPEALARVDCQTCHVEEGATYTHHGRGVLGETEDLPACQDCHGSHQILPSTDRDSATHPTHLSQTCGVCHSDLDLAKKHDIQLKRPVEVYESSVHGKAALGGVYVAATCTDCHSTGGTAHRILAPGDPTSSINHFNVPRTCGQCHHGIEQDYWEGIHGKLALRGETDTPVCTTCHGEHGILPTDDPRSNVSPSLVAQSTCAPCHESARLNEKYGIPAGRLASFVDSYHGLKSKAGDPTVANCASCHGAHRILQSSNPESSIYPANLKETCGHCHPGITTELAQTPIHGANTSLHIGISDIVTKIYIVAIVVIIGLMTLHVLIDLRKRNLDLLAKPQVRRMDANGIFQHSVLMISFIVLVVTGFALRYSEAWIFKTLFGWDGGFSVRGLIHRGAAVVLVLGSIWHVFYLRTRNGKIFWKGMIPSFEDFKQFIQMMLYNLGRSKDHPKFGRFGYVEKAEYWALVWGTVVMIVTGFFLWFDNLAVAFFPKGFLDVMLVIHFYEAWLATLAIAVWHMYATVFRPGVYPGNPSWVTGKMPIDMYEEEHPGDKEFKEAPKVDQPLGEITPAAGRKS